MSRRRRRKKPKQLDPSQVSEKKESRIGSFGLALKEAFKGSKPGSEERAEIQRHAEPNPENKGDVFSRATRTISKLASRSAKIDFVATQYPNRKAGVETEIVVGFDFGTSSSKVILQDVDRRQAYAVPFPGVAPSGHDYLLPTKVFVDQDGVFSFSAQKHELSLLKNKLFAGTSHVATRGQPNVAPEIAAVAYFTLALREARQYFMRSVARDVAPGTIIWSINVGLPEKSRQQRKSRLLEICALAGWECSVWNDSVTIDLAQYWFEEISRAKGEAADLAYIEDEDRDLHPDQVVAVPEVVAQVQGYARSDLRRTGLHMMVDVGATTLDASTFTLFDRDHEDRYTIWESQVALLGALSLHMHRLRGVSKSLNAHLRKMIGKVDTVSATPSRKEMVPNFTEEDIHGIESDFANKAGVLLANMVTDTHKHKNPKAPEWREGLRVFLCGGGRGIPLYRKRLETLPGADGCKGPYSWLAPFQFLELPKPDNLHAPQLVPSDYHRLAVAYGLSFRFEDIGGYEEGPEIDDDEKESERNWQASFVGPELT